MQDVENGSYLRSGAIYAELNRRLSFVRFASVKGILSKHLTRLNYDNSRADLLKMISRKISYKEHLIKLQDTELTEGLHKKISSVENEISTLLAFVMAFDSMADFMANETAGAVDQWYQTNQKNLILNQLLDAQTERAASWSNTAFSLHDHLLNPNPTAHA